MLDTREMIDVVQLLADSQPPDFEMVDLIEWAYLEGQIDGRTADLAYYALLQTEQMQGVGHEPT